MMPSSPHALVTGASRGLGAAFARALAKEGHAVSLVARSTDAMERIAADIRASGGRAEIVSCDVIDAANVGKAIESSVAVLGPIGILVNNAGVVEPVSTVAASDPAAWARHIEINLIGAFNVLHHATPHLARGGVVVNVSSGASQEPFTGRSAYCSSKAGLNMLSRVFELEEAADRSIRVMTFTPGPTDTGMHATIREAPVNQSASFKAPALRPVEDAAQFLVWLCSSAAADLAGRFVDAQDPSVRQRAGLA
jgi:3-oxoacyl-[acyl-carrier protein] reductase